MAMYVLLAGSVLLAASGAVEAQFCNYTAVVKTTVGAACKAFPQIECRGPSLYCTASDTCARAPMSGESCSPSSDGAFCYSNTSNFVEFFSSTGPACTGAVGSETCGQSPWLPGGWCCSADTQCLHGTCTGGFCTGLATAATCAHDTYRESACDWMDYCRNSDKTCRPRVATGQACVESEDQWGICERSAACVNSTCVALNSVQNGGTCNILSKRVGSVCASGWCDSVTATCVAAPAQFSTGAGCNGTSTNCAGGSGEFDETCSCFAGDLTEGQCSPQSALSMLRFARTKCSSEVTALTQCHSTVPNCPVGWLESQCCCTEVLALASCMKTPLDGVLSTQEMLAEAALPLSFEFPTSCPASPVCTVGTTGTTATTATTGDPTTGSTTGVATTGSKDSAAGTLGTGVCTIAALLLATAPVV